MEWPFRFPRPADVIAEEAQRFAAAPVAERMRQLAEVTELARQSVAAPARQRASDAVALAAEERWQAAHRRVFEQHEHAWRATPAASSTPWPSTLPRSANSQFTTR
jgi:hypothetical protein